MSAKKIWKFLSSMRFAIILLVILAAACALGSFITQGQSYDWYAQTYSERTAGLIVALRLDDVFHSLWFILITAFLCGNLLLCNLIRLPQLIARWKREKSVDAALSGPVTAEADGVTEPEKLFEKLRMGKPVSGTSEDGRETLFSVKNRIGIWGAWVTHLGILLLILGFGLGQMTHQEYVVYGVPGQSRQIGDTSYVLTIDDFSVELREDDTVEQYIADITVYDLSADGSAHGRSAQISVNHPADLYGMRFYQNSTGWAANIAVTEKGEPLQDEVVCAGEYIRVKDMQDLVIYFNAFYPDYVQNEGARPSTASGQLNNPAYLYSVYSQDQINGMNALMEGETITIDDYEVTFSQPQSYTLIQVKRDSFQWLALLGGVITTLGLVLSFYTQMSKVWAVKEEDGTWRVSSYSPKGGALYRERFAEAAGEQYIREEEENGTA